MLNKDQLQPNKSNKIRITEDASLVYKKMEFVKPIFKEEPLK